MPASSPPLLESAAQALAALGRQIRLYRKRLRITAVAAAEAAGLSRVTLQRIERGEPSVTIGAYLAVIGALGLELSLHDPAEALAAAVPLPDKIRVADYPQLKQLAWQLGATEDLTPQEALALYERNWRHVDRAAMPTHERELVARLAAALGGGRLFV
ncbi:MAG: helix-turn-helix domain-containing protein [Pseudomonadota bacterium]